VFADHHQLLLLVEGLHGFHHQAITRLLMFFFFLNDDSDPQCIADEDRTDEAQPLISIGHGQLIEGIGCQPYGDAEDQRAMRYSFLEGLCLAPLFIHMMREKIAGLPCMDHNIRLGDCPAGRLSRVVDYEIFKM